MLRRPFANFVFAAALALCAVPAFAAESHAAAVCDSSPAEATGTCDATADAAAPHPGNNPARSKYVHSTPGVTSGGGGDSDDSAVIHNSVRNSKWHSFLPGMFR